MKRPRSARVPDRRSRINGWEGDRRRRGISIGGRSGRDRSARNRRRYRDGIGRNRSRHAGRRAGRKGINVISLRYAGCVADDKTRRCRHPRPRALTSGGKARWLFRRARLRRIVVIKHGIAADVDQCGRISRSVRPHRL